MVNPILLCCLCFFCCQWSLLFLFLLAVANKSSHNGSYPQKLLIGCILVKKLVHNWIFLLLFGKKLFLELRLHTLFCCFYGFQHLRLLWPFSRTTSPVWSFKPKLSHLTGFCASTSLVTGFVFHWDMVPLQVLLVFTSVRFRTNCDLVP